MDAFVSHSSQDADFANRLVERLESQGVGCWIAPRDIAPGGDYAAAIIDAIQRSGCVALIFTPEANASPHVLREVERAVAYRRPIIPLRLVEINPSGALDYLLATLQWASACGVGPEDALGVFADAVRSTLDVAKGKSAPPPPLATRDRTEAHDRLWQICADIELGYRRALRESLDDDHWTALGARSVALNEYLIVNGRHFPRSLREAADAHVRGIAQLGQHLRSQPPSQTSRDFSETRELSLEELQAGMALFEAVKTFESARTHFEAEFHASDSRPI